MQGLSGSVEMMPLRDLLAYLAARQLTGTLECEQGEDRKSIVLHEGVAIRAASSHPDEYLSHLLVEHGHASPEQIEMALGQGGGQHLGSVLVDAGLITESVVREVATLKIRATVVSLLGWSTGTFQFIAADDMPKRPSVPATVELGPLCQDDATDAAWPGLRRAAAHHGDDVHFAAEFRKEVGERLAERGRGKRFPKDLQRRAVAYYYARTHQGSFLSEVARELGLPPPTLRRWVLDAPPGADALVAEHPVEAPQHLPAVIGPSGRPVLVGPGGFRIEGLDLESLAALLRRLE